MDVVPLLGAIVEYHCSVLWLGGRVTTNFGGVDVVPLLGAIVACHCSVLWLRGGNDQLWGSGRGAIAGCHMVGEGRALGEWTWCHYWVPLQGANFCFISSSYFQGHQFHADAQENNMNLASCRRYTVLYIDNTKNVFCYLGSMLVSFWGGALKIDWLSL